MPILSFSVPAMLPSVAMGVMAKGQLDFGDFAVDEFWSRIHDQSELSDDENIYEYMDRTGRGHKTQTIRPYDYLNPNPRSWHSRIRPGDYCDIWWKQRAPKLAFKIGRVKLIAVHQVRIVRPDGRQWVKGYISESRSSLEYLPKFQVGDGLDEDPFMDEMDSDQLIKLALADGFKSIGEFRDYFTPKPGDEFRGNMLVW